MGYRKLWLEPGDRRTVSIEVRLRESGRYELSAGSRSTTVRVP